MAIDTTGAGIPRWLRNSPTYFVAVIDLKGGCAFVNDLFRRQGLLPEQDLPGLPASSTIHPDDWPKCQAAARRCLATPHQTRNVEVRLAAAGSAQVRWTSWDLSCLHDENARPAGILCVGHDSSPARHARTMDTILETITDGFFVLDCHWRFMRVNAVAEKIIGRAGGKLVGTCFWSIFPDTPSRTYPAAFRRALRENTTVRFEEFKPELGRWFEIVAYPSAEGLTVFFRDTSEKHAAEDNLRLYERQLRAIFNSGSEIKVMMDTNRRVMYFNQNALDAARKLFDTQIVIGTDFMEYVHEENRADFSTYIERALNGEFVDAETHMVLPCHHSVWVWLRFYPVRDEGQIVGVSYNASNITGKKKAQERLLSQNEALREINWHQSHAIRRPVANILGLMHLIEQAGLLSGTHAFFLDHLQQATHELDQVIGTIVAKSNDTL